MPRSTPAATAQRKARGRPAASQGGNGQAPDSGDGRVAVDRRVLEELVEALDAARRGDFSVRLSKRRKGVMGEVAAAYNELVATNERDDARAGPDRPRHRPRGPHERARLAAGAAGTGRRASTRSTPDRRPRAPHTEVGRVLKAVADGDLSQEMALTIEGQPVKGEFLRIGTTVNTMVDQLSSFADEVTRVAARWAPRASSAVRPRCRACQGTWRDLTDSVNFMATQPHRPGAQHRRGDHRGGQGRSHARDHRGRPRRGARAQEHRQHDGRPAVVVRRRGHARRARGRHRGQARRSGRGAGRVGHLARPDRERELHGREPDRPGPRHRRRDHRGGQRRPLPEDHRGDKGEVGALADTINSMVDTLRRVRRAGDHAWPARSAPRASSAVRPRCRAWPAPGRTSPTR